MTQTSGRIHWIRQRDKGKVVVVCLTVHWPCNSSVILQCLQKGFYTWCIYLQIKQCLVLYWISLLEGIQTNLQSSVPKHPNYTARHKACIGSRVWPPAFTITAGCLFSPPLPLGLFPTSCTLSTVRSLPRRSSARGSWSVFLEFPLLSQMKFWGMQSLGVESRQCNGRKH